MVEPLFVEAPRLDVSAVVAERKGVAVLEHATAIVRNARTSDHGWTLGGRTARRQRFSHGRDSQ
jgi:hypothetical protein